ncbi:response regulator transcription factor [Lachnotalea sp. AF33-28]|jgi:two-component system response regulator YesN|uniref:response regulator transcription factor n=1 Tax=Lachnotalea sp. AF33-28 TaxID=2292046 RepID=UPI000E46B5D8|nr:response regulator [Lachnotalea sp. AF33-28]RHP31042.1 response regulator [Lachnotalea sp. AF33-28]
MINLVIVEDETNIRECLQSLFPWSSLGVEVSAAFANGQEAYKYLMSHSADLLLTDIRLPGLTGLELVQMLREGRNMIPVIILTGYRQFDYAQQAIRYKVDDFLLKPIKYEELTAAILRIRDKLEAGLTQEAGPAGSALDSTYHERIISSAKQYLTAHLTDASLEEAAISVNLSPGYFSRLFHKVTGETFSDYLTGCRMKKAAEYLHGTNYKTYEISLMVGYDNPKNFTRAFKQYYHVTPREFRDNR